MHHKSWSGCLKIAASAGSVWCYHICPCGMPAGQPNSPVRFPCHPHPSQCTRYPSEPCMPIPDISYPMPVHHTSLLTIFSSPSQSPAIPLPLPVYSVSQWTIYADPEYFISYAGVLSKPAHHFLYAAKPTTPGSAINAGLLNVPVHHKSICHDGTPMSLEDILLSSIRKVENNQVATHASAPHLPLYPICFCTWNPHHQYMPVENNSMYADAP